MAYPTVRRSRAGRLLRGVLATAGAVAVGAASGAVLGAPAAAQPTTFIYNGSAVDWSEHTEIARLYRRAPGGTAMCAATFLSDSWMLTAAHCATDSADTDPDSGGNTLHPEAVAPENLTVIAQTGTHKVDEVTVHPDFTVGLGLADNDQDCTASCEAQAVLQYAAHDVAVLHLAGPAAGVGHAELLGDTGAITSETPLTAFGWGDTDPGGPVAVSQPLLATPPGVLYPVGEPFPGCNPAADQSIETQPSILCVQSRGGLSGAGAGDSGGPWFVSWDDGTTRQVAVTSFGSETGYPTRVPEQEAFLPPMTDWIEDATDGAASVSAPSAGAAAVPGPPDAGSPGTPGPDEPAGSPGGAGSLGSLASLAGG